MGLYNFKEQFVPAILSGDKTHTIRATRAHPDKPGNTLHLYTGLRQKGARLLMRVTCTKVENIKIEKIAGPFSGATWYEVRIGESLLDNSEREQLARRDGFADFRAMMRFWEGRLPFEGHIIHWRKP
jgi:hypothetical protein